MKKVPIEELERASKKGDPQEALTASMLLMSNKINNFQPLLEAAIDAVDDGNNKWKKGTPMFKLREAIETASFIEVPE